MPKRSTPGGRRQLSLAEQVGRSSTRRLRARQAAADDAGSGLSFMGLVGWSVATPTLLGVVLGRWLDGGHPGQVRWTIALLTGGIAIGCYSAWHWITLDERKSPTVGDRDDA